MILKSEFLRYALSGLIFNCLGFITFVVLLVYLNFSPVMSASIQYPIIICIYYLMQTYFVFNKKINAKNLGLFLLNQLFLYFLNIIALLTCVEILNLDAMLSQFLIIVILVLINFRIQKKIIYN
jgi:putative flippase GtrA